MNVLSRKEKILLAIGLVFGILVLVSYFVLGTPPTLPPEQLRGTPVPFSSSQIIPDPQISTPSSRIAAEKLPSILKLQEDLPYDGVYIQLLYNQDTDVFAYAYRQDYPQASENELIQLLKKYQLTKEDLTTYGFEEYFY